MVTRHDQIPSYDRVFRAVLPRRGATTLPEPLQLTRPGRGPRAQSVLQVPETEPGTEGRDEQEARLGLIASDAATLKYKAFAACTPEELAALRRIMKPDPADPAAPAHPADRRRARAGRAPDLRRTVRETMRMHGEPAELFWRRRRLRLRPLILILDVSGSMADYSRNLLQFAYSTRRATARVEVFCFGTRLTRITRELEHRRVDDAHGAGGQGGLRLGGRHPDRRLAGHVRARLGAARAVPRRHRGDLLGRAGPRRPAACWPPRWTGCPGSATGWSG